MSPISVNHATTTDIKMNFTITITCTQAQWRRQGQSRSTVLQIQFKNFTLMFSVPFLLELRRGHVNNAVITKNIIDLLYRRGSHSLQNLIISRS